VAELASLLNLRLNWKELQAKSFHDFSVLFKEKPINIGMREILDALIGVSRQQALSKTIQHVVLDTRSFPYLDPHYERCRESRDAETRDAYFNALGNAEALQAYEIVS